MNPGDHPSDDALSALATDEPAGAEADVAEHVARCDRCRRLVDDERAVRSMLGGLPEVEPPERFFTDLIRRRHRHALAAAGAGVLAAVVAWGLVVGDTSGVTGTVRPDLEDLRAHHLGLAAVAEAAVAEADGAETGGEASSSDPMEQMDEMADDDDMPAPYREPATLAGSFSRIDRFHGDDGTVMVTYRDGTRWLTLFEQAGELDTGDLPGEMDPVDLGHGAWELDTAVVRIVVVPRGDLVYTLVGDVGASVMEEAVQELPAERPMGLARRVTTAVDDLVEDFGLGL